MKRIGIIGATGKIGTQILNHLKDTPLQIRAGSRNPSGKESVNPNVKWVAFSYADESTMPSFFEHLDAFFFIAPQKDPLPAVERMLKEAREAGVQEVIFSSGRTTGDVLGRPLHAVEEQVKELGLRWTIFRPGWFMQNFVDSLDPTRHGNQLTLPTADSKTAFVDVRDIGAVAARLLQKGVLHGRTLDLTSLEALDHHEVARQISEAGGIPVEYIPVEEDQFVQAMVDDWGWEEETARFTAYLYRFVADGKEEEVSRDIVQVLGKEPISFAQFARDYADHWKK